MSIATVELIFLVRLLVIPYCEADVNVEPTNLIISSRYAAMFNCCTNVSDIGIKWKVKKSSSTSPEDISPEECGKQIDCISKFTVDKTLRNCAPLTVADTQLSDAGVYICTDLDGMGRGVSAELVVFESRCRKEVVGGENLVHNMINATKTFYGATTTQQDKVAYDCEFNYTGNLPLSGQWKFVFSNQSVIVINSSTSEDVEREIKQVTFRTEVKIVMAMNGGKFRFEIDNSNFTWTSNTSISNEYQTLSPYTMDERHPPISTPSIELETPGDSLTSSNSNLVLWIVLPIVLTIIITAIIIVIVLQKRRSANDLPPRNESIALQEVQYLNRNPTPESD